MQQTQHLGCPLRLKPGSIRNYFCVTKCCATFHTKEEAVYSTISRWQGSYLNCQTSAKLVAYMVVSPTWVQKLLLDHSESWVQFSSVLSIKPTVLHTLEGHPSHGICIWSEKVRETTAAYFILSIRSVIRNLFLRHEPVKCLNFFFFFYGPAFKMWQRNTTK